MPKKRELKRELARCGKVIARQDVEIARLLDELEHLKAYTNQLYDSVPNPLLTLQMRGVKYSVVLDDCITNE